MSSADSSCRPRLPQHSHIFAARFGTSLEVAQSLSRQGVPGPPQKTSSDLTIRVLAEEGCGLEGIVVETLDASTVHFDRTSTNVQMSSVYRDVYTGSTWLP